MSMMITDECINCDVCLPECPTTPSPRAMRFTSSIPTNAPNASATSIRRSVLKCAGRLYSAEPDYVETKEQLQASFCAFPLEK